MDHFHVFLRGIDRYRDDPERFILPEIDARGLAAEFRGLGGGL